VRQKARYDVTWGLLDRRKNFVEVRGGRRSDQISSDVSFVGTTFSVNSNDNRIVKRSYCEAAVDYLRNNVYYDQRRQNIGDVGICRRLSLQYWQFFSIGSLIKRVSVVVRLRAENSSGNRILILSPFPNDISNHTYADITTFYCAYAWVLMEWWRQISNCRKRYWNW